MVALAKHDGVQPVSIGVISRESAVPYAYLEQLIVPLRRAGLVSSKRGAHGGYTLSRAASEISVGEVYRAMEGPVAPMECVSENEAEQTCPLIPGCQTRPVWIEGPRFDRRRDRLDHAAGSDRNPACRSYPRSGCCWVVKQAS